MNLLDIILLAIALAMDCFAVSIVSGVLTQRRYIPRMSILFGFFHQSTSTSYTVVVSCSYKY